MKGHVPSINDYHQLTISFFGKDPPWYDFEKIKMSGRKEGGRREAGRRGKEERKEKRKGSGEELKKVPQDNCRIKCSSFKYN